MTTTLTLPKNNIIKLQLLTTQLILNKNINLKGTIKTVLSTTIFNYILLMSSVHTKLKNTITITIIHHFFCQFNE